MLDENNEKTGRADGTGAHINAPEVPDGRERMPPVQAGSGGGGVFASFALFWTVSGTFAVLRCNYQFGKESLKFGIFALPEEWEDTARRRGRNRANCRDVRADETICPKTERAGNGLILAVCAVEVDGGIIFCPDEEGGSPRTPNIYTHGAFPDVGGTVHIPYDLVRFGAFCVP